ncbi:MAG: glycosyltransferase [Paludibacteraceae bacterium]|nr:glycosyltransferase [Paludibacteraceae bacterium]
MTNILYILNATILTGGATKAILHIIDNASHHNVNPIFIVPNQIGVYEYLMQRQFKAYAFPYRNSCYPPVYDWKTFVLFLPKLLARLTVNLVAIIRTIQIIRHDNIQLVHTNTGVNSFGWWAAKATHTPHIWHIREYGDLDFNFHFFPSIHIHQLLLKHSHTICITNHIQSHFNLAQNPCSHVIYDGVLSVTQCASIAEKYNYFLYAGRIEPAKGLEDLLNALARCDKFIHNDTYILKVAGKANDDEYDQYIRNKIQQLKLTSKVELLGERTDVLDLMHRASAVIVPSRNEGFGFVMPEAQFMGSLVIAHDTGGTHEQFVNGRTLTKDEIGLSYSTEQTLIDWINAICSSAIDTQQIIQRGQQAATTLYSVETHCQRIYQLYSAIIQNTK